MIQDYRLLDLIGQGGMGEVYRAVNVILNQPCAIKLLKPERMETPEAFSRFRREIKLLGQLKHQNIVGALHAGEHDGRLFLVMDYVHGVNLNQLVRRIGPLPVPEACTIIKLVANALQYAHEQKVIHRDIKPSNVMVTTDGEVKL
jgi:serine/threonine-protein kinase